MHIKHSIIILSLVLIQSVMCMIVCDCLYIPSRNRRPKLLERRTRIDIQRFLTENKIYEWRKWRRGKVRKNIVDFILKNTLILKIGRLSLARENMADSDLVIIPCKVFNHRFFAIYRVRFIIKGIKWLGATGSKVVLNVKIDFITNNTTWYTDPIISENTSQVRPNSGPHGPCTVYNSWDSGQSLRATPHMFTCSLEKK